LLYQIYRMILN